MDYTTVKLPVPTYGLAKRIQAEITKKGTDGLPHDVKSLIEAASCPFDYSQLEPAEGIWFKCHKCGFQKPVVEIYKASTREILGIVALSAIVALGLAALAKALKK